MPFGSFRIAGVQVHCVLHGDLAGARSFSFFSTLFPFFLHALPTFAAAHQLVAEFSEFDHEALGSISAGFWGCLVLWFAEYRHSNMFHNYFYRLLYAVLHNNHEPSLQVWLLFAAPHLASHDELISGFFIARIRLFLATSSSFPS